MSLLCSLPQAAAQISLFSKSLKSTLTCTASNFAFRARLAAVNSNYAINVSPSLGWLPSSEPATYSQTVMPWFYCSLESSTGYTHRPFLSRTAMIIIFGGINPVVSR